MKGNELYSKRWCEMLFESRNKNYGAYKLRRDTGHRYKVALIIVFFLSIAIIGVFFVASKAINTKYKIVNPIDKITRLDGVELKEARPARKQPKQELCENAEKLEKDKPDVETQDDEVFSLHPEDATQDNLKIEELPIDSMNVVREEAKLDLANDLQQTKGSIVDSIAHYPEGLRAFMQWLNKSVVYPPKCIRQHIEGTVTVAFIVERNGAIKDGRVIKNSHPLLEKEVLRVIKTMPPWKPAIKNGHPVVSQVTLPIVFDMND